MIDRLDIRPGDRVLLLSIPDARLVAALADRLEEGLLLGVGRAGEIYAARKAARDRTNVMFQPGLAAEIPWQNAYFSKVIDLAGYWPVPAKAAREVARVLAPAGIAYLAVPDPKPLLDNGLTEEPPIGDLRVFRAAP